MKLTQEQALQLIEWYQENKRTLPWRDTNDPYDVWLSEIMLQQTRVEAVKEKFIAFKEELSTIEALANVDEDRLLKLWEGLGYYNRARNLKKCAQVLVENYNGKLPSSKDELLSLPGIGPYTSGAIASIGFGKMEPAIDGNVLRVFARLFAYSEDIKDPKTRKLFEDVVTSYYQEHGEALLNQYENGASLFTQALMELGALVCVPNGEPHCEDCCWKDCCLAHINNQTDTIPYRKPLKKRKIVLRTILILKDDQKTFLRKRDSNGLLASLYEFPGFDGHLSKSEAVEKAETLGVECLRIQRVENSKHIFSHLEWHMIAYEIKVADVSKVQLEDGIFLTKEEGKHFAVPSAFKTYRHYLED